MILTEAAIRNNLADSQPNVPTRQGYEYGIPRGGSTAQLTQTYSNERIMLMEQLHDAYMACEPTSDCVDVTARSVTAGGLLLVPDDDVPEGQQPIEPTNVQALRRLMRFTNPREDMVQVLRGVVSDLEIFGDAYLEVSSLAGQPVALYSLDSASMTVLADEHGDVEGYVQYIDFKRKVQFNPEQIIHFSLDSARGGLYGVSPVQKSLISVTSWLFTASCLKELMRRGDPPRIHADMPKGMNSQETQKWYESYMSKNLGVKNIGTPIITTGGGQVVEMAHSKLTDYIDALKQLRDEIFQTHGVPPSKGNVIESGNLGGGTGEAQDKTWRVNKIIPLQSIVLEKLNYSLAQVGFGIVGWHLEFEEMDFRDSTVVENIRVARLIHGAYTFNRYRSEIGEPPVPGGDDAMILDRGKFVFLKDMSAYTQAEMNQMNAPLVAAGDQVNPTTGVPGNDGTQAAAVGVVPTGKERPKPDPPPSPFGAIAALTGKVPPDASNVPDAQQGKGKQPDKESRNADDEAAALKESLNKAYQFRRKKALKGLPDATPANGKDGE